MIVDVFYKLYFFEDELDARTRFESTPRLLAILPPPDLVTFIELPLDTTMIDQHHEEDDFTLFHSRL